jgi:hypothetical protein
VVNANFSDLASLAAGDFLIDKAHRFTRNVTGQTDLAAGMQRARSEYPEIAALYNGGRVTPDNLRTLLWPLFKTTNEYSSSKTELRKYGEQHVYHDSVGREYRRY